VRPAPGRGPAPGWGPAPGPRKGPSPLYGLTVHHADAHLIVVEKPPGLLTHLTHPGPGPSLLELVRREWPEHPDAIAPVHRLDAGTSGLAVLGRTPEALRDLGRQFAAGEVRKRYLAIAVGEIGPDAGVIDLVIGSDPDSHTRGRQRVGGPGAREARTRFRVLARRDGYTLLALTPETGRPHQIRVHLAAIGHPVAGDRLYGTPHSGLGRHALHAAGLALRHPDDGRVLRFRTRLPDDLRGFWKGLDVAVPAAARLA